jgi:hypothetical protein
MTVKRAKTVLAKGTREEIEAVQDGKETVSTIAKQIHSGMTPEERKAALEAKRPLKKDKTPLAERGKNPERIQRRQMNALIWRQVREALEHLTGLPQPSDVVEIVRGIPKAIPMVDARLARAVKYLGELQDAWNNHEGREGA